MIISVNPKTMNVDSGMLTETIVAARRLPTTGVHEVEGTEIPARFSV
jgi:hypothetical protein